MFTSAFMWVACLLLMLQDIIKQWSGTPLLGYLDQLLVLAIFALGIVQQALRSNSVSKLAIFVMALFAFLVVISVFFGLPRDNFSILAQCFIHTEFFVLAAGFYAISLYVDISPARLLLLLVGVTFFGLALNAMLGDRLFSLLHVSSNKASEALGRMSGFQLNPNRSGIMLALGAVYLLERLRVQVVAKWRLYVPLAALTLLIVMTGSRTALGIEAIAVIFTVRLRNLPMQVGLVSAAVICALLMQSDMFALIYEKTVQNFSQLSGSDEVTYPRWLLISTGLDLATQYFPLGAGAATYGSVMSVGSVVYAKEGLLSFSSIADMKTVYDSNLASILGEFGLLGVVMFYGGLVFAIKKISPSVDFGIGLRGFFGINRINVMIFLMSVFCAISNPFFSNSYYAAMFLVLLVALKKQSK